MMNGLNILPSFYNEISLNTAGQSVNTGIIWVGGCVAGFFSGPIIDKWGRKAGMMGAVWVTVVGIILQSAAVNPPMFIVGRFIVGIGVGISSVACPTYVSEVAQLRWRAFSLGFYYDFWYGGGMIASGVTYGTARIMSSWAWRIPSILQVVPSILCLVILPFIPESPRWLMYHDRADEVSRDISLTAAIPLIRNRHSKSSPSCLRTVTSRILWSSRNTIRLQTRSHMRRRTNQARAGQTLSRRRRAGDG